MCDPVGEGVECRAVVEIGNGDPVAGGAQLFGELADAVGEALRVVEQDHIGHERSSGCAGRSVAMGTVAVSSCLASRPSSWTNSMRRSTRTAIPLTDSSFTRPVRWTAVGVRSAPGSRTSNSTGSRRNASDPRWPPSGLRGVTRRPGPSGTRDHVRDLSASASRRRRTPRRSECIPTVWANAHPSVPASRSGCSADAGHLTDADSARQTASFMHCQPRSDNDRTDGGPMTTQQESTHSSMATTLPASWFEGFDARAFAVNGASIFVRYGGNSRGPTLLLLHGSPQSHVMWHRAVQALQARYFIVLPDLRGFGDSSKLTDLPDHSSYTCLLY